MTSIHVVARPIQVVIMARFDTATPWLADWLDRHNLPWRYGSPEFGIDCARNQNIVRFLREDVPNGRKHLLMIDKDMVPLPATDAILKAEGDLLYCGYVDREGSAGHCSPTGFGAACFRASATMLQKMQDEGVAPPWFEMGYNPERTRRTHCECLDFQRRAAKVGVKSQMAGVIGHLQTCIVVPDGQSPGYRALWPHELDAANIIRRMPSATNNPTTAPMLARRRFTSRHAGLDRDRAKAQGE